jgi:Holliday junction resolvasome RuvABC endonuclease subunit
LQNSIGNNVVTYRTLAEVRGVLEELFTELKIPYQIVFSGTWKSALSIKGARSAEQKRAAQEYVLNKYSIKATQDTCDAICIGSHILSSNKYQKKEDFS